jgi:copper chaperone CopZ
MKKLLLILFLTFIPIKAQAIIIDISVEGMVCDFCAQSIEKVFMKQPGVEVVYVNLDRGNVQVKMADIFKDNEPGISDDKINQLFEDAGYTVSNITRK